MIPPLRGRSAKFWLGIATLAPIIAMSGLLLFAPPDGTERWQFMQFLGRFHPLSVHLPIALLLLVPLLELAGRTRYFPYLLPAVDFLLGVSLCGAIVATVLGWLLARGGGYSGSLMTQHMWAGVMLACMAWLCWFLRGSGAGTPHRLYFFALAMTVGLVSFTGYRGGQLSQGENHLTEFMPEPLAAVLGVSTQERIPTNSANGGPSTFYGARIQPILNRQCISCHGRNKHKARLRLDSYEAVLHGGKHGPAVKAGDPKGSDLLRRITLSQSDDDVMPPDGKRPVAEGDAKIIARWIAAGASGTQSNSADLPASSSTQPAAEVTFEESDPAAVAQKRAGLAPVVAQLQRRLPNVIEYESRNSADITITAAWMGLKFGDSELAALAPLSEHIVAADFSQTSITDKSAGVIAAMKHLRVLRMMHTRIGDAVPKALGSFSQLESLGVSDTAVTPLGLQGLAGLPKLQHVYVGDMKVRPGAQLPEAVLRKLVFSSWNNMNVHRLVKGGLWGEGN